MDLNVLVFGWLESADIRRRYRNSKVTKFHFFEILWPTFTQFRPCMCHHLPRITVTSTEAKALRKISRPKFIAYGFADMASRRNLLKFQFLGNRERITELSGPLRVAHWALPQWIEKSRFGDQIRGPDPRSQNLEFWTSRLSPVLWPTFFRAFWQRISCCTMCKRLGRSTSKWPPKLGVWKFLGAWHFLSLPPFGGYYPILPVNIMGLSTLTQRFFILRESLSI